MKRAGEKGEAARADWAHVFLSVLPQLPLSAIADEVRVAAALRAAGATVMARHGAGLRRAAVAQWEVRLPVPDASGAWRLVVSSPTGASLDGVPLSPFCKLFDLKLVDVSHPPEWSSQRSRACMRNFVGQH